MSVTTARWGLGRLAVGLALALAAGGCGSAAKPSPGYPGPGPEEAEKPAPSEVDGAEAPPPAGPLVAEGGEGPAPAPAPPRPTPAPAPAPAGGGGFGGALDDAIKRQSIEDQERKALAEHYYQSGQKLYEGLRYHEAAVDLRLAVKNDPDHVAARQLLDQCLYILGETEPGLRDQLREAADEREAKMKLAGMEVERLYNEGLRLMDRSEYGRAAEYFERVIETIRYFPYNLDRSGLMAQAEAKLAEARALEERREQDLRKAQQEAALEDARLLEKRDLAFQEARVRSLFEQAITAYDRTDFERCELLCDRILKQEPDHTQAAKLRDRAATSRRLKAELQVIEQEMEMMQRVLEGVYEASVPYQAIFAFPSDEAWQAVLQRAVDLQEQFERKGEPESIAEQQIKAALGSRRVTINFPDTSFADAIQFLREITGLNFVPTKEAEEAAADKQITLRLRDIILRNALDLILESFPGELVHKIKNDVISINTKEAEKEDLVLRFYEVSEIVNDFPDYPGPRFALAPGESTGAGGGGGGGAILDLGGEEESETGTGIPADKLKELIEAKIGEGEGSVEFLGGILMVRKPLSAHKDIEKLLESLRKTVGVMVTVEAKMIDIQDNFLEEIGIDFRGLPAIIASYLGPGIPGPTGVPGIAGNNANIGFNWTNDTQDFDFRSALINFFSQSLGTSASTPFQITNSGGLGIQYNDLDDFQVQAIFEAVKKKQKARQVDAPRVTVFNGQRSHVMSAKQEAYIKDIEVNQTGVTPTINPVIDILNSGSILEVRPIVSHDRKYVTLEIQPQLAVDLTTPANTTTLRLNQVGGAFNTVVDIELPVVSLNEIQTTVVVPDGGTVIVGGLRNLQAQDFWKGLPIIRNVPLLHNLFERKGYTDLKRSLIVLLSVKITIVREEEARRFNLQPPPPSR